MDAAASTAALGPVAARVQEFLPWYSSIHRGAGYKSQLSTRAYENARAAALAFAGRAPGGPGDDTAIICRNTTEALNHLAYRLRLAPDDVVVTTVAEHHANLLPWSRAATCRYVECGTDGTFTVGDAAAGRFPPTPTSWPGAATRCTHPHALAAARLAAEDAIGVRHGCFCAHPNLMRLLHPASCMPG